MKKNFVLAMIFVALLTGCASTEVSTKSFRTQTESDGSKITMYNIHEWWSRNLNSNYGFGMYIFENPYGEFYLNLKAVNWNTKYYPFMEKIDVITEFEAMSFTFPKESRFQGVGNIAGTETYQECVQRLMNPTEISRFYALLSHADVRVVIHGAEIESKEIKVNKKQCNIMRATIDKFYEMSGYTRSRLD